MEGRREGGAGGKQLRRKKGKEVEGLTAWKTEEMEEQEKNR